MNPFDSFFTVEGIFVCGLSTDIWKNFYSHLVRCIILLVLHVCSFSVRGEEIA